MFAPDSPPLSRETYDATSKLLVDRPDHHSHGESEEEAFSYNFGQGEVGTYKIQQRRSALYTCAADGS